MAGFSAQTGRNKDLTPDNQNFAKIALYYMLMFLKNSSFSALTTTPIIRMVAIKTSSR